MNYNEKLESLAKEFDATVNHAVEVMEEYVATAIEQEVMEEYIVTAIEKEVMDAIDKLSTNYRQTIDKLSQEEKEMLLAFAMLDELKQSQPEEPEKVWALLLNEAMEQMKQEQLKEKQFQEEMRKYLFG